MRRLWLLLAVAALVVPALPVSSAYATSGTLTITTDTTLTEDHLGSVVIAADNVTLDCAGHRLVGPGESNNGVTLPGTNGVTVKNCTVTGFDGGFNIQGGSNLLVNNRVFNTAEGNGFSIGRPPGGVVVAGNTLTGNVTSGGRHGFWLVDTSDNRLRNNTATGSDVGIQVNGGGTGNELRGNTLTANDYGILLAFDANGNTVSGNTAGGNRIGIILQGAAVSGNLLTWNTARDNAQTGFLLTDGTSRNVLIGNVATSNAWNGFWVSGSSHTLLTGNTATRNGSIPEEWFSGGVMVDSLDGFSAHDNVLTGNAANGNNGFGFMVAGHGDLVRGAVLRGNTANGNTWFGFGAWRATGNSWQDNTANDNGHWGFALFNPCLTNTLTGNVGRRNGEFDAYDDDIPMLNSWTNNKFAKTTPKGL